MFDILHFIRLEDGIELVVLAVLLASIGGNMANPSSKTYQRARRISAAAFLLYAGMGICEWTPSTAADVLLIVLRAMLAAGLSFGLALVTLAPISFLIGQAKEFMPARSQPKPPAPRPAPERPVQVRDHAAVERAEKERKGRIDDARTEATQFYEKNQELLEETLPLALFRSQLRTRFPDGITPDQAWAATQTLITEMLPMIATARNQQRAVQEAERKRVEKAQDDERKQKEVEERAAAFQKLAEWYQREQDIIRRALPEGQDQSDALQQLFERYDQLMKETYAEMKP